MGDLVPVDLGDGVFIKQIISKIKIMINAALIFSWIFAFYVMADQKPFNIETHQSEDLD